MNNYIRGYMVDEEKYMILTTVRDVERVKASLHIGDLVETPTKKYGFNNDKYCEIVPRMLPIVGLHPYLAETEDPRTGRRYTVPYKDIALSRRRVEA